MNHAETLVVAGESKTLEPGQRLGDFLLTRVVGRGGFGVVYEAEDLTLQRRVAIKEYMPAQLAARTDGVVHPASSRYAKTFELGRRSFLAEARLLAQFSHPGLLEVLHFWEQNGTAYMVMPFYEGRTLDQVLANGPNVVSEAWLRAVIRPVLDALEHMHGEDCYHRDVSADNILLCNDGKALLLDLGAARRVIGESDRAMTVMLKPGYAPIEQYADDPACRQGPWTDIYSVAALLYFAVTNRMPPASASRVMHDSLPPLSTLELPGYGGRFLEAIDRGLSIRPEERPRTVGEFRSMLFAASPGEGIQGMRAMGSPADDEAREPAQGDEARAAAGGVQRRAPAPATLAWAGGVAAVLVAAVAWLALGERAASPSLSSSMDVALDVPAAAPGSGSPASAMNALSMGGGMAGPTSVDTSPANASPADARSANANSADAASTPPRNFFAAAGGGAGAPATGQPSTALSFQVPQDDDLPSKTAHADTASPKTAQQAAAPVVAPTGAGTVRLAVTPWGEVFVDGVSRGITPPLKQLSLDAGSHRIEIRNPAGPTWQTQVDLAAGQRITLAHRFR